MPAFFYTYSAVCQLPYNHASLRGSFMPQHGTVCSGIYLRSEEEEEKRRRMHGMK